MGKKEFNVRKKAFIRHIGPLAAFAATLLVFGQALMCLQNSSLGDRMELAVLNLFFEQRGERHAPENVIIAALDDVTLQDYQDTVSPRDKFPRILEAQALAKINSAGPAVVIIDLKFPNETDSPEADDILEAQLRQYPVTIWNGEHAESHGGEIGLDKFKSITIPSAPRFANAAKMQLNMWTSATHGIAARIALSANPDVDDFTRFVLLKPLRELTSLTSYTPGNYDFINYYGPPGHIKRASISKILKMDNVALNDTFHGKVVLFGYQSETLGRGQIDKDQFKVAVSDNEMFGVEIHANIAANLLDGSFIHYPNPETTANYLTIFFYILIAIGILTSPEKAALILIAVATAYSAAAYTMFSRYYFWLPGACTVWISTVVIVTISSIYHYKILKRVEGVWVNNLRFDLEDVERPTWNFPPLLKRLKAFFHLNDRSDKEGPKD